MVIYTYLSKSTSIILQFLQVYKTLWIGHVDIMVGMIGHCRPSPSADLIKGDVGSKTT